MHTALTYIAFFSVAILSLRLMAHTLSIRKSFLIITILWSLLIVTSTELLSLWGSFNLSGLSIFWGLTVILIGTTPLNFKPAELMERFKILRSLNFPDKCLNVGIALILLLTGITALVAPPNNWDSMTYHMSRVAHWIQNMSVQFYPTAISRQLWASPWSEYAIAQLQILSQSDRLANIVQWWSMLGSVIGVSLIAKNLGAGRRGQILSAAICASIPVGILQASSTQNDYTASLWCVTFIYFGQTWLSHPHFYTAFLAAICLGLAALTKSTTLLFLFPFICLMSAIGIKRSAQRFPAAVALLIAIPLLITAPQFFRNYQLDGNIFSLTSESKTVTNSSHNIQTITSNALRYLGLNLCTPNEALNQDIASGIEKIHKTLGWDIVDPRITFGETFKIKHDIHEDNSCNTALTIILLLISILFVLRAHWKNHKELTGYVVSLAGGFLLFFLMLKWQPWGNRLLLPLYVISAPFLGTLFEKKYPRSGLVITFILLLLSIPWLTHNRSRPLVTPPTIFTKDRGEQYFNNIPGEYFSYHRATEEIQKSGCQKIGLVMSIESWEYPLWPLLGAPHTKDLRIEHVNVSNVTKKYDYPLGTFEPCIVVHDDAEEITKISINNIKYIKTDQWAYLSLFRKDPDGKLNQLVRKSSFNQMLQLSFASTQKLKEAQTRGSIDPSVLDQVLNMRRLAVQNAGMLDLDDLNSLYPELGSAVKNLFIEGNKLFMDGLYEQNQGKITEGEQRLEIWNNWFAKNANELQKLFE